MGPFAAAQIASCEFTYEDVLLREDFAVKNAVPTAEGAIQILMEELPQTIDGMKILLVGSGRISKILRRKLRALGAAVSVCCRRSEEAAWALADGCEVLEPEALASCVRLADAVINTVPAKLLTEPVLRQIRPQSLVIDLASAPGGVQWAGGIRLGGAHHLGAVAARKMRAGACGRNPVRNRLPDPKGVGTSWPVNRRWAFA